MAKQLKDGWLTFQLFFQCYTNIILPKVVMTFKMLSQCYFLATGRCKKIFSLCYSLFEAWRELGAFSIFMYLSFKDVAESDAEWLPLWRSSNARLHIKRCRVGAGSSPFTHHRQSLSTWSCQSRSGYEKSFHQFLKPICHDANCCKLTATANRMCSSSHVV